MASLARFHCGGLCFLIFLTFFVHFCVADGYYQYSINDHDLERGWGFPILKIEKRQAEKEKSKVDLIKEEKPTELDQENSSKQKGVNPSGNKVADISEEQQITNTTDTVNNKDKRLNETDTIVDYDGQNVTVANITQDHHRYYNSTTFLNPEEAMRHWIEFDNIPAEKISTHEMLSQSHRRAATVGLSFDFPFYGHLVRNVTIATGGFLYTGDYVHSWLAATQYIAPLMANFDTSLSNDSTIKYYDNGTAFTVQWEQVVLQDRVSAGNFTFQATLLNNGDIIFAYKEIPIPVTSIGDEAHPVKVGVSDAYIIDRTIFFVRRKTIYEYHKVDMKKEDLSNGTAIYFSALPTCVTLRSCETCISNTIGFECVWCSNAGRCSDGMDRHRQEWLMRGCDKYYVDDLPKCNGSISNATTPTAAVMFTSISPINTTTTAKTTPLPSTSTKNNEWEIWTPSVLVNNVVIGQTTQHPFTNQWITNKDTVPNAADRHSSVDGSVIPEQHGSSTAAVVGILFFVAILVSAVGWVFYAYRNPHTPSGQCLIRFRPSQWRWRSGEAHYTAASIHM